MGTSVFTQSQHCSTLLFFHLNSPAFSIFILIAFTLDLLYWIEGPIRRTEHAHYRSERYNQLIRCVSPLCVAQPSFRVMGFYRSVLCATEPVHKLLFLCNSLEKEKALLHETLAGHVIYVQWKSMYDVKRNYVWMTQSTDNHLFIQIITKQYEFKHIITYEK